MGGFLSGAAVRAWKAVSASASRQSGRHPHDRHSSARRDLPRQATRRGEQDHCCGAPQTGAQCREFEPCLVATRTFVGTAMIGSSAPIWPASDCFLALPHARTGSRPEGWQMPESGLGVACAAACLLNLLHGHRAGRANLLIAEKSARQSNPEPNPRC